MTKIFIILIISINISFADDDCLFFKYCGGSGGSRSAKSLPSNSAASSLNPSNVSSVKGFGVETLYQKGNPLNFNIVSGNGKVGALISPSLENSFFGNRSVEIDDLSYTRRLNKKQFDNSKLNLSVGMKILSKKYIGIDLGLSAKRNPDIKKINPGAGINGRVAFLHFGAYFYQDDLKINLVDYVNPYTNVLYSTIYGSSIYQEKFSVETYTMGTNIRNLSIDTGVIKTRYKFYGENTRIYLYSSSYSYRKFLFNVAIRKEYSPNLAFYNGNMILMRKKSDYYYGVQYSVNNYFVLGLQYNNFLLNEWSGTLTIYF